VLFFNFEALVEFGKLLAATLAKLARLVKLAFTKYPFELSLLIYYKILALPFSAVFKPA
jgi:hypothetical protein